MNIAFVADKWWSSAIGGKKMHRLRHFEAPSGQLDDFTTNPLLRSEITGNASEMR
jgi:hypothetical protein